VYFISIRRDCYFVFCALNYPSLFLPAVNGGDLVVLLLSPFLTEEHNEVPDKEDDARPVDYRKSGLCFHNFDSTEITSYFYESVNIGCQKVKCPTKIKKLIKAKENEKSQDDFNGVIF
jgi:hypothetical protein